MLTILLFFNKSIGLKGLALLTLWTVSRGSSNWRDSDGEYNEGRIRGPLRYRQVNRLPK